MGGFSLFQIELTRGYGQAEFREDLKKVYRQASMQAQGLRVIYQTCIHSRCATLCQNTGGVLLIVRHVVDFCHSQPPPQAGVEGKPVVFLLPDSKIVSEGFLEDVNNMLNSGEVSGWPPPWCGTACLLERGIVPVVLLQEICGQVVPRSMGEKSCHPASARRDAVAILVTTRNPRPADNSTCPWR
jgi:hypothetical protein